MGRFSVILLDTHAVLWFTSEPAKLSKAARIAIDDARYRGEGLALCDISLLELTTVANKGRILLGISLETFLNESVNRFVVFPISAKAGAKMRDLPANYPADPADRIIGATALVEGIPLVTADPGIRRAKALHPVW
jgi:PIN domain nuclease of toxin-antitoxin system